MAPCKVTRGINWTNLVFFAFMLLMTLTALPWYALHHGISRTEWLLFWILVITTGFSITVGYHRLFAHRSFEANRIVTFFTLFFGAAAFEQSALMWASQHRDHHRYVDTENDPYNIKKGFWYAHITWMLFWQQETDYTNVKDLSADPLIMHQHKHYGVWAIGTGIILPLIIGAVTGHLLGAFLVGVVGRLTFVHHSTFSINSICHTFGRATYDINATAKDHWLVALITNGEGYHNFHHRFPGDYRNGVRWYQWDPSKWLIAVLSCFGLTGKLYRTAPYRILEAKSAAERQRVEQELAHRKNQEIAPLLDGLQKRYTDLKTALYEWEKWEREYRMAVSKKSSDYIRSVRQQLKEKRRQFGNARREWILFVNTHPLIPSAAHV